MHKSICLGNDQQSEQISKGWLTHKSGPVRGSGSRSGVSEDLDDFKVSLWLEHWPRVHTQTIFVEYMGVLKEKKNPGQLKQQFIVQ